MPRLPLSHAAQLGVLLLACLTSTRLPAADFDALRDKEAKALALWRALCLAKPEHGKAEVAQALADELGGDDGREGTATHGFVVPAYIADAIRHVTK